MQRARTRRGEHVDALAHEVSPEDYPPDQEDATAARELWTAVRPAEKQRDAVLLIYAEDA